MVPPGAASAGVVAMECERVTWRVRGHPCNARRREFPDAGESLPTRRVGWDGPRPADLDTVNDHPARRTPSPREDHCTVPRARPPEVRQEHPVPTGAELIKVQVRTAVAQSPPAVDATGVWYVEYGSL